MKFKIILPIFIFLLILPAINATYIKLTQDKNLADAGVDSNGPDTNYGGDAWFTIYNGNTPISRAYATFDITDIPAGVTINHCNFTALNYADGFGTSVGIYEVTAAWAEDAITHNTQPCGTGFDNAGNCNLTAESNFAAVGTGLDTWNNTGMVKHAISLGRDNVSFVIRSSEAAGVEADNYRSKEHGTASERPFMECDYTDIPPAIPDFRISAADEYDAAAINNFTIIITNSTYRENRSTENGTIIIADATNGIYDINFSSDANGGYFNISTINYNISTDLTGILHQAVLYINASEIITGTKINSFTANSPLHNNQSNSTGWAKLLFRSGSFDISIDSTNYLTAFSEIEISALEIRYINFTLASSNLTINATDKSGNLITNFSINLTLLSLNYKENKSTTNGSLIFRTIPGTYNLSIDATGYAIDSELITISTGNAFPNVTFSLFTENTININVYDEELNKLINTTTTTIIFDGNNSIKETVMTSNGTYVKPNLAEGLVDISASTVFHNQRHYFVTIVPQSITNLNIYLLNSTNGATITFNIKDQQDRPIENAFMAATNKVNTTHVVIEQKYSDFAGQVKFFLKPTTKYRFALEAEGYTTKIFDLEPSSASYTIVMTTIDSIPFTTILDKVSYAILPIGTIVNASQQYNFSFITNSPGGHVTYFGLNTTVNNVSYLTTVSGSVGGGTASISVNLSNMIGKSFSIDHFMQITEEDLIIIHKTYYTSSVIDPGNYSAVSVLDKYSGNFTTVMKSFISVLGTTALILSFAEIGVPAAMLGIIGVGSLTFFAIIGWVPTLIAFIVGIIIVGMYIARSWS